MEWKSRHGRMVLWWQRMCFGYTGIARVTQKVALAAGCCVESNSHRRANTLFARARQSTHAAQLCFSFAYIIDF